MIKVGFIGNIDSVSAYVEALEQAVEENRILPKGFIVNNPLEKERKPLEMGKTLLSCADEGFEAVLVLDEGIDDKEEMFSGIRYYLENCKIEHETRVIFVASTERLSSDEDVCSLAYEGVYDLVLPFKGDDPVATAVDLIWNPATIDNVRYVMGSGSKPFDSTAYEARHSNLVPPKRDDRPRIEIPRNTQANQKVDVDGSAPAAKRKTKSEEKEEESQAEERSEERARREAENAAQRSFLTANHRIIGVSTLGYRGGSTTLALHIATTIFQLVYKYSPEKPAFPPVAVVTSEKTFNAMKSIYRSRVELMDGGRFARFPGFDVYVGYHVGVPDPGYTYTVLDLGWIPQKRAMRDQVHAEMEDILEFKCNLAAYAIPMGTAEDLEAFVDFTKDHTESAIKRKSYVLWGATAEMADKAKASMHRHCPNAFVEDMGWISMPEWISGEIDPKMVSLLENVVDLDCLREYKRAVKRKERAAEAVPAEAGEGAPVETEGETGEPKRKFGLGTLFGKGRQDSAKH